MEKLSEEKLSNIKGGITVGVAVTILSGLFIGVCFLSSAIYGFVHPEECQK